MNNNQDSLLTDLDDICNKLAKQDIDIEWNISKEENNV
jgi:hypothetical protein